MDTGQNQRFDYQRMDLYRAAIEFARWQRLLGRRFRRGNAELSDQLGRASISVVLNTAEGCGEFSTPERARFFRMARRSADECAAALDLLEEFGLIAGANLEPGRVLLDRIIAMLTALIGRTQPTSRAPRR